ncbi:MAG TPA: 16S rRNA (cytosine(1402)-N(4))-methyltransferase RsmH [Pirellulales bacterium]|jgi:16S rRNA (cytosine1402-N4)-methyltransferase|nr:16S rRNA (cytosine(1402)-N(4))-methyltransferase RsmH [Pirellulales bacterium]
MDQPPPIHVPVMLDEVVESLDPRAGQTFVDGTLGGGGHTEALAQRVGAAGLIVSFDQDPLALASAEQRLAGMPIKLVHASFRELPQVLKQLEITEINGIVLDLGLSSDQLADEGRGFSFDASGSLDLRFDPTCGEPAWQLLEKLNATQLADLIYNYGEERHSRRIARRIVEERAQSPIRTARQLAELVRRSVPRERHAPRIDPATRTFQALRIAVNDELGALRAALAAIPAYLAHGGRVAVISFHSLEDRIVKESFRDDLRYRSLTRKPMRPTDAEVERNPRSRSAKMRVAERIA